MSETNETDVMVSLDKAAEMIAAAFRAGEAKGRAGSVAGAQDRALLQDPVAQERYAERFPNARRLVDAGRISQTPAEVEKRVQAAAAARVDPQFPNANRLNKGY